MKPKAGIEVEFTRDQLGASRRDDLAHVVAETFGVGDRGFMAFPHPHKATATAGWWYVKVASKTEPGEKLFVPVRQDMWRPVPR